MPRNNRFLAFAVLLLTWGGACAETPLKLEETHSQEGQIVVESPDLLLSETALNIAIENRKKLEPLLGLPPVGVNHILIRILPADPKKDWPQPFITALLRNGQLDFSIQLRVPGPNVTEEFIRALTSVCLYEKVLANNQSFQAGKTLPLLPLWLAEGTLQQILSSGDRNWEKVVNRAKKVHKAPSLETVTKWEDLSGDSIERMWQQAFTYYLVASITKPGPSREAFQQWLQKADTEGRAPFDTYPPSMPDEFAWRAQLERSSERTSDLLYTWEETREKLGPALEIILPAKGSEKEVRTTIDSLKPYQKHPGLADVATVKLAVLTELQARSTAPWQPVLNVYRAALMSVANIQTPTPKSEVIPSRGTKTPSIETLQKGATYAELITLARKLTAEVEKQHSLVEDYLNWVVVTKSAGEQGSAFAAYYTLQKKLNDFQPRKTDKMSRNILRIENASSARTTKE